MNLEEALGCREPSSEAADILNEVKDQPAENSAEEELPGSTGAQPPPLALYRG